ncbi:MAG: cation diffusion facilitator family transporter [Candidatus Izemoplasmataceae bacterium]
MKEKSDRRIGIAFILNASFTVIEIIGAFYTNSMAILSDAVHDAGDSISLLLSYLFEKKSKKGADKSYTYGYERFSLLGALVSSFVLFGAAIFILSQAIPRLFNPEDVDPVGMIILSIGGILFNGLAVFKLKKGSTHHEKVVTLHLLEDFLGWSAILVTSIFLLFFHLPLIDTILAILITIYIVVHVSLNLLEVVRVLLQRVPSDINIDELEEKVMAIKGIKKAYHTHVWSLEGSKTMCTMHITLEDSKDVKVMQKLKERVRDTLEDEGIDHATIECD